MKLAENYICFKENLADIFSKYGGSFVVIKDCKIIAAYQSFGQAVSETRKTEQPGTFIVQESVERIDKNLAAFHGNVLELL